MGYSDHSTRSVRSLTELKAGDHIRVQAAAGTGLKKKSASVSASGYERCDRKYITHHLLVVKAIDDTHVIVIHKVPEGVEEDKKQYRPRDVTVLEYYSRYMGEEAVQRARQRKGDDYRLLIGNCEHFVTEVRTGEKQCKQIQGAVVGGVGGGAGGAIALGAAGAVAGAAIGAAVCSWFPVVGPLVGGFLGGIIGGIAGGSAGGAGGAAGGTALGIRRANK